MKRAETLFRALANEIRLRILNLLIERPLCVCEIVSILGMPYSRLSNHLSILKKVSLAEERKVGWWVQYSLRPVEARTARALLLKVVAGFRLQDALFRKDLKALRSDGLNRPPEEICRQMMCRRDSSAVRKKVKN